ncbi:MAG: YiaA/YiaB family inner membrane protein [Moraxella sp.]|nr:YiaA/YiaB family inner membrane protein [Moraxella sp.]
MSVGLWNATLLLSEKGYYFMVFALLPFVVIAIQKNIRDLQAVGADKLDDEFFMTDE